MVMRKEVYIYRYSNTAVIAAGEYTAIDIQELAKKSNYLPLNKIKCYNSSGEEILICLDVLNFVTPDYKISANSGFDESVDEGIQFNTVYLKNNSATDVQIGELVLRVSKVIEE
jgi:hypothetical protein